MQSILTFGSDDLDITKQTTSEVLPSVYGYDISPNSTVQ